jgi:hypothetical protein
MTRILSRGYVGEEQGPTRSRQLPEGDGSSNLGTY